MSISKNHWVLDYNFSIFLENPIGENQQAGEAFEKARELGYQGQYYQ
jgi:hypothetical protein